MLLGIFIGILVVLVLYILYETEMLATAVFIVAVATLIVSCNRSDWYQAGEREKEAKQAVIDKAEATPRVIREFDGCKVYTFKAAGHWHYFTRCAGGTVTEAHRTETEGSGKHTKQVDVTEVITTKN